MRLYYLLFHFNVYRMISHTQSIYSSLAIINEISLVKTGYLLERERERERLTVNTVKNSPRVIYTKTTNCAFFLTYFLSNILHPDVAVPENPLLCLPLRL